MIKSQSVEPTAVGVVVARFQAHELHAAQVELLKYVLERHPTVIVVLGLSPLPFGTTRNPLMFEPRKQMLLETFKDVNVIYQKDLPDDDIWSKQIDAKISDLLTAVQDATLYGGRDSFIDHYTGKFPTVELESDSHISNTAVRASIARTVRPSADFRAGVIYGLSNRPPTVYTTVDIAIWNEDRTKLLLGRKKHEKQFRFIGGFADPGSPSFEADARREVQEEASISITDPKYVGSRIQDDWRYRNELDRIKTILFEATHQFGRPEPADDIEEVKWFSWSDLTDDAVVSTHVPLLAMLREHRSSQGV